MERNKYSDLEIGQKASIARKITEKDILDFAEITGDKNPLHVDKEYAKTSIFGGLIAHGALTISLVSAVLGTKLPGPGYIYLSQEVKFFKPVFPEDTIKAEVEVIRKIDSNKSIELKLTCSNQREEVVLNGNTIIKAPPDLL